MTSAIGAASAHGVRGRASCKRLVGPEYGVTTNEAEIERCLAWHGSWHGAEDCPARLGFACADGDGVNRRLTPATPRTSASVPFHLEPEVPAGGI